MRRDLNKVQFTGRLGDDPARRATGTSTAVHFHVASNRSWRDADGVLIEQTEWFKVVAWAGMADLCLDTLHKGTRVYIEGRLQTRSWIEQPSGQSRSKTEVIASDLILLDQPRHDSRTRELSVDEPILVVPQPMPVPSRQRSHPKQQQVPAPASTSVPVVVAQSVARPVSQAGTGRRRTGWEDEEDAPY